MWEGGQLWPLSRWQKWAVPGLKASSSPERAKPPNMACSLGAEYVCVRLCGSILGCLLKAPRFGGRQLGQQGGRTGARGGLPGRRSAVAVGTAGGEGGPEPSV